MQSKKWSLGLGLLLLVALMGGLLRIIDRDWLKFGLGEDDCGGGACGSGRLTPLWHAPAFAGVDQHGEPFTDQNLKGHVWLANFIFTTCTSACPLMTSRLMLVQHNAIDPGLRFVSFSVDPERDTPNALNAYASSWNAAESRWTLVHLSPEQLQKVVAGFKVDLARTGNPNDPIIHSSSLFLVDDRGNVRGIYNSEWRERLQALIVDARSLAEQSQPKPPPGKVPGETSARSSSTGGPAESPHAKAITGEQLFEQLSCQGCHLNPKVAPSLTGVAGRTVTLDDGSILVADDEYLRESILKPAQRVVAGYLKLMPYYRDFLTDDEANKLIAHLHTLKVDEGGPGQGESGSAGESPARIERDPVCGMEVVARGDVLQATHQGKTYYFCAESCRRSFISTPKMYVDRP